MINFNATENRTAVPCFLAGRGVVAANGFGRIAVRSKAPIP